MARRGWETKLGEGMRNKLAAIGLVAFLALDVALVVLALRPGRLASSEPPVAEPTVAVTTTARPSSTSRPRATATSASTGTPAQALPPSPVAVTLGSLDGTTAWRAATGSCAEGGSAIFVTGDGGESWDTTKSPSRALTRIQPLDQDRVFVVGAGADCALKQFASNDRGESWQAPTSVAGGWARSSTRRPTC